MLSKVGGLLGRARRRMIPSRSSAAGSPTLEEQFGKRCRHEGDSSRRKPAQHQKTQERIERPSTQPIHRKKRPPQPPPPSRRPRRKRPRQCISRRTDKLEWRANLTKSRGEAAVQVQGGRAKTFLWVVALASGARSVQRLLAEAKGQRDARRSVPWRIPQASCEGPREYCSSLHPSDQPAALCWPVGCSVVWRTSPALGRGCVHFVRQTWELGVLLAAPVLGAGVQR